MLLVETHIVTLIKARIRIQEYGPLVFKTLPTRSSFKKAIKKELVTINGEIAKTSDWVEEGQIIEVFQKDFNQKIFQLKLKILFEDDHLAIIDKPSGFPTSGNYFKTIENALSFNLKASAEIDALQYPMPVHRLDNPTSGVLIIAKTKAAQICLNLQFEEKQITKTYTAIVKGIATEDTYFIDDVAGKSAESYLSTSKTFSRNNHNYSLIMLQPKTGRTHQLRVHCANAKLPIVGDHIYGIKNEKMSLLLHASEIKLRHPIFQNELIISSPMPKRFENFLNLS